MGNHAFHRQVRLAGVRRPQNRADTGSGAGRGGSRGRCCRRYRSSGGGRERHATKVASPCSPHKGGDRHHGALYRGVNHCLRNAQGLFAVGEPLVASKVLPAPPFAGSPALARTALGAPRPLRTLGGGTGNIAVRTNDAHSVPTAMPDRPRVVRSRTGYDWTPDLRVRVGSLDWFRGVASLILLITLTLLLAPRMTPWAEPGPTLDAADRAALNAAGITPMTSGGQTGRRMVATAAERHATHIADAPRIETTLTLGHGLALVPMLTRLGASPGEARSVADAVSRDVALGALRPGTRVSVALGPRPSTSATRPIERVALTARLDLALAVERIDGQLRLTRTAIPVDTSPLRIEGVVDESIYLAARSAGAEPAAVQAYLRRIGTQLSVATDVQRGDRFAMVMEHRRSATGETEVGKLLYAGLVRDGHPVVQMIEFTTGGRTAWFEASRVGVRRDGLARPTPGAMTSRYGLRMHPILRYRRLHAGNDYGGGYGAPIYAVTDGVVAMAGRKGGYGNYVRITHGQGLASGYAHMSAMLVSPGERVTRGTLIGRIGSTGLSTGPHLHFELYRNGAPVDPNSVAFVTQSGLPPAELAAFRARLRALGGIDITESQGGETTADTGQQSLSGNIDPSANGRPEGIDPFR